MQGFFMYCIEKIYFIKMIVSKIPQNTDKDTIVDTGM